MQNNLLSFFPSLPFSPMDIFHFCGEATYEAFGADFGGTKLLGQIVEFKWLANMN